jgi:hypothetical protein
VKETEIVRHKWTDEMDSSLKKMAEMGVGVDGLVDTLNRIYNTALTANAITSRASQQGYKIYREYPVKNSKITPLPLNENMLDTNFDISHDAPDEK